MRIEISINGTSHEADVEPRLLLVDFIRNVAGLTGTSSGCDTSSCGACTVLLDGVSVKSCTVLAVRARDREVTTIEGLPADHPLKVAFHDEHALQCGFCTPGMVLASVSVLAENPDPTEAEIRIGLKGNLCRCTGYHNIVRAIRAAATEMMK